MRSAPHVKLGSPTSRTTVLFSDQSVVPFAGRKVPKPTKTHPLVGTWITDEEDSNSAFVIKVAGGKFAVSGFCRSTKERFKITRIRWDGVSLSFDAVFPSTAWKSGHVLQLRADGRMKHELTIWEIWKKKAVKPGQLPEAWKPKKKSSGISPLDRVRRA